MKIRQSGEAGVILNEMALHGASSGATGGALTIIRQTLVPIAAAANL
jgi:hypothetical protein